MKCLHKLDAQKKLNDYLYNFYMFLFKVNIISLICYAYFVNGVELIYNSNMCALTVV